jgi:hypothetical protein
VLLSTAVSDMSAPLLEAVVPRRSILPRRRRIYSEPALRLTD